jgi:flagella basal body P-ring formation protein FlgA
MRTLLIWLALALAASAAECVTITGDKIVARDLAQAIPEFSSAPSGEVLSFAPIPGMIRIFKASDIARFAQRFKIALGEGSPRDVCFLSAAAVLTEDQIRAAILPAIPWRVVSLKVLDFSRSALPPGRLEFKATGLTQSSVNPAGTTVWHGRLVMDSGHTFPVWVKLCILVEAKTVVSAREIEKNRILTSEDVAYLNEAPFPLPEGILTSLDEATGRNAVRNLAKGSPILKWMLEQPREVVQGQVVHVDSICGDAHLSFEARAQSSGRRGDEITVRNPNGGSFRARVIDKDKVEVRSSAGD